MLQSDRYIHVRFDYNSCWNNTARLGEWEREKEKGSDKTGYVAEWPGRERELGLIPKGVKGLEGSEPWKWSSIRRELLSLSLSVDAPMAHTRVPNSQLTTFRAKDWRKLCFVPGLCTLSYVIGGFTQDNNPLWRYQLKPGVQKHFHALRCSTFIALNLNLLSRQWVVLFDRFSKVYSTNLFGNQYVKFVIQRNSNIVGVFIWVSPKRFSPKDF